MAWFTKPYNWLTDLGQLIGVRADRHNAQDNAFVNGISGAWLVDPTVNGQNPPFNSGNSSVPTVNVNVGGFRMINAADGIGAQDLATVSQLTGATNSPVWGGVFAGTANAVTITLSPPLAAYGTGGIYIEGIVGNTNTGNVTVNVDGLGAKSVLKNGTQQLEPGDWKAGQAVQILWDGTNFHNLSPVNGLLSQNGTQLFATAGGTANALTATLNPVPGFTSYPNGFTVWIKAASTSTAAVTLNVSGIGIKNVVDTNGVALTYGAIRTGRTYGFSYNTVSDNFQLISPFSVPLYRNGVSIYGLDVGIASALAVTLNPALTNAELLPGTTLFVKALNASTGATTIALSGGTPINIVKLGATALAANDILANQIIELCYDGVNFQIQSPLGNNVTNIATGNGLTGGPITSTGTISFGSGTIVQDVTSTGSTSDTTNTDFGGNPLIAPTQAGGKEFTTLSITPKNAGSILEIFFSCPVATGTNGSVMVCSLFRDATANAINTFWFTGVTGNTTSINIFHRVAAVAAVATTFKIRFAPVSAGGNMYMLIDPAGAEAFGNTPSWTFSIKEILP